MTHDHLITEAGLDKLIAALDAMLPPAKAIPIPPVGCWYLAPGAGATWMRLNVAEWVWYRLIGCEGAYVRRDR